MNDNQAMFDKRILFELARRRMPYGKYKDRLLCDLPEPYLVWFAGQGFPQGELGVLLRTLYEIKVNGLEGLLKPLKHNPSNQPKGQSGT
jgi:uncharacterized protein (DUF3820 family)